MNLTEEMVLEALKTKSKKDPLTRRELKQITGMSRDSNARSVIKNLRSQGFRILSSSQAKGYWIAESEEDYKEFCREYSSKAYTILNILRAMDAHTEGQQSINGL